MAGSSNYDAVYQQLMDDSSNKADDMEADVVAGSGQLPPPQRDLSGELITNEFDEGDYDIQYHEDNGSEDENDGDEGRPVYISPRTSYLQPPRRINDEEESSSSSSVSSASAMLQGPPGDFPKRLFGGDDANYDGGNYASSSRHYSGHYSAGPGASGYEEDAMEGGGANEEEGGANDEEGEANEEEGDVNYHYGASQRMSLSNPILVDIADSSPESSIKSGRLYAAMPVSKAEDAMAAELKRKLKIQKKKGRGGGKKEVPKKRQTADDRVGPCFQADVPPYFDGPELYDADYEDADSEDESIDGRGTAMWIPSEDWSDRRLDIFIEEAALATNGGNGGNGVSSSKNNSVSRDFRDANNGEGGPESQEDAEDQEDAKVAPVSEEVALSVLYYACYDDRAALSLLSDYEPAPSVWSGEEKETFHQIFTSGYAKERPGHEEQPNKKRLWEIWQVAFPHKDMKEVVAYYYKYKTERKRKSVIDKRNRKFLFSDLKEVKKRAMELYERSLKEKERCLSSPMSASSSGRTASPTKRGCARRSAGPPSALASQPLSSASQPRSPSPQAVPLPTEVCSNCGEHPAVSRGGVCQVCDIFGEVIVLSSDDENSSPPREQEEEPSEMGEESKEMEKLRQLEKDLRQVDEEEEPMETDAYHFDTIDLNQPSASTSQQRSFQPQLLSVAQRTLMNGHFSGHNFPVQSREETLAEALRRTRFRPHDTDYLAGIFSKRRPRVVPTDMHYVDKDNPSLRRVASCTDQEWQGDMDELDGRVAALKAEVSKNRNKIFAQKLHLEGFADKLKDILVFDHPADAEGTSPASSNCSKTSE